jgi:predicted DNA-binding transcriptional regulator YafY
MGARNNDRSATTRISAELREALLGGRPMTYQELASSAGCDERTVRNYLRDPGWARGLELTRTRGADGRVRVTCPASAPPVSFETMALDLARDILRRFFPIAGTALDRRRKRSVSNVVVASVRGAFEYEERHLAVVRKWLAAVNEPRRAVSFSYRSLSSEHGPRRVWPVGVLIRGMAAVYLVGQPAGSKDRRALRTYALERVDAPVILLSSKESGAAPPHLAKLSTADAGDMPFSIFRATGRDAVNAKLRFSAAVAEQILGRRWHARQRVRRLRDGRVEVQFGPVDVDEVVDWVREWEGNVEVLGDARVRGELRATASGFRAGIHND